MGRETHSPQAIGYQKDFILSMCYNIFLMGTYTAIDLFCGAGGMRLGAERTGRIKFLWACDNDKWACKTYTRNFGDVPLCTDVCTISSKEIPKHDLLFAGFPCNSFSTFGVAHRAARNKDSGLGCTRYGGLIWEVARIVEDLRPKAIVLENVKNLAFHRKGETIAEIAVEFARIGYPLSWRVLNAYPYVPQNRYRTFLVGVDTTVLHSFCMRFPKPPKATPTIGPLLLPAEEVPDRCYLSTSLWEYLNRATNKKHASYGSFRHTVCPPDGIARTLCARYHSDGREILIDGGRETPRRLTTREAARIMGFPDTFEFPVSIHQTYRQLGNAVVPPLIEALTKNLLWSIEHPI